MRIETLYDEALKLPDDEREELASRLLSSVQPEPDYDRAWNDELERRIRRVRQDSASLVDAADVLRDAKRRIDARRR